MPRYSFTEHFEKLTGYAPFPWQQRLHDKYLGKAEIPRFIDIPTGLGKTSVMAIWLLARLHGAELPLRLVYIVDRRAVVDQATEEAIQLECKLIKNFSEFGLERDPGIAISTLRGQHVDNQQWLYNPAKPAIIVGTVDMIGSRLLFNGHGVSRCMRSVHAGMLGTDTLFVIDEAHLVPPFEALCNAVAKGVDNSGQGLGLPVKRKRLQLLALSATRRAGASEQSEQVLRLSPEDKTDPTASKRLAAVKRLHIDKTVQSEKELAEALFTRAWELGKEKPGPILIYADKRNVVEKVHKQLQKKLGKKKDQAELFVGSRRVYERAEASEWLKNNGFIKSEQVKPCILSFLVATSAGEVGVDMDAAHAVMDIVPWERMVQRLGRINRRGEGQAEVFVCEHKDHKRLENDKKRLVDTLFNRAWQLGKESQGQILIYTDEDGVAEELHDKLQTELKKKKGQNEGQVELFVVNQRVYGRPNASAWLKEHGFINPEQEGSGKPSYLVAALSGEVDIDRNATHAVMDLADWEQMIRQLGKSKQSSERQAEFHVYEQPTHYKRLQNVKKLLGMLPTSNEDSYYSANPNDLGKLADENSELVKDASSKTRHHPALTKPLAEGWSLTGIRNNTSSPDVKPWLRGWNEDDDNPATTTIIWRRHMPFTKKNDGRLAVNETAVKNYLKHARIRLAEQLEIDSDSKAFGDWIKKHIFQHLSSKQKNEEQNDGQTENPSPAGLLVVKPDGGLVELNSKRKSYYIYGQDNDFDGKGFQKNFLQSLRNRILVLDASLGGLNNNGLLEINAVNKPRTIDADSQDDGMDVNDKGFEVKVVVKDSTTASEHPASEDSSIVIATDGDNEPSKWLAVIRQANTDAPETDAGGEISSRSSNFVTLADHTKHVTEKVSEYCGRLKMPVVMKNVFTQAAELHDQGKAVPIWQDAMGAKAKGRPYAKTRSANGRMLGGYRHEFGSILAAKEDSKWLNDLNEDDRELALHLVATHHGNAMPYISFAGSELPPSIAEATALEIQLRRYRLQRQFGVWGLAWLEAVFRAADRAASNEEGSARR